MVFISFLTNGQAEKTHSTSDKLNALIYVRSIEDAAGNVRIDQNIVLNARVTEWLRAEAGFRLGERAGKFHAYTGYKAELQSRYWFNRVRLLARISEKINEYPLPTSTVTNYLLIAEGRYPLSQKFLVMGSIGYVWSGTHENTVDARPTLAGKQSRYPTYRFGIRYRLHNKGFLEALTGAYDVFNPYLLSSPFVQLTLDYDISRTCTFYSYYRYQYYKSVGNPLNNFVTVGLRVKLVED